MAFLSAQRKNEYVDKLFAPCDNISSYMAVYIF